MIKVSIIIPYLNRKELVDRCLKSLVNQTLKGIEIILVDDGSDKDTNKLIGYYKKRYLNIKVFRNIGKGAGAARNYGLKFAEGKYVTFIDSDDYVELWAFEKMYETISKNDADIALAPYFLVEGDNIKIAGKIENFSDATKSEILLKTIPNFWNKIYKKDILLSYGDIPLLEKGEDTAYVLPLISTLNKIAYFDKPYYYYMIINTSISNAMDNVNIINNFKIMDECFQQGNPEYFRELRLRLASRLIWYMQRPQNLGLKDLFIQYLKENRKEYLYEPQFSKHRYVYNRIYDAINLPDTVIPTTIWLDGFSTEASPEYINIVKKKAFRNGCTVQVMNLNNCDVYENDVVEHAYRHQKYSFLAEFFAIKNIYKYGGIFISPSISINQGFDFIRYDNAFFSYYYLDTISSYIFGGKANNIIFKLLLESYKNNYLYENSFEPVGSRIKSIIKVKYNIHLNGDTIRTDDNITIYDISHFMIHISSDFNACEYNFNNDLETLTIPVKLINQMLEKYKNNYEFLKQEKKNLQQKLVHAKYAKEKSFKELNSIKQSEAFNIGKLIVFIPHQIKEAIRKRK